jgi:hypothetical protein
MTPMSVAAGTLRSLKEYNLADWRSTRRYARMTGCTPNYARLRDPTQKNFEVLQTVLHDIFDSR